MAGAKGTTPPARPLRAWYRLSEAARRRGLPPRYDRRHTIPGSQSASHPSSRAQLDDPHQDSLARH